MTRQEQIKQQAKLLCNTVSPEEYFILGAQWADAHPNIDTLVELHKRDIADVAAAYEDWNKARIQELIADACEWLEDTWEKRYSLKLLNNLKRQCNNDTTRTNKRTSTIFSR